ncbi:MAG: GNAT family N-acetyltransferase [Blastocatellia bacterium]
MPAQVQLSRPFQLRCGSLEISLATTLPELDEAMRLRFAVFNQELGEGLDASWERGYDTDAYDTYCDHLIARDRDSGRVVGTYRLLRRRVAERHLGFYAENEFDLAPLKRLPGESMELGRSCVAPSHRSFATINLLWNAITEYAQVHGVSHLFGCASLHCATAAAAGPLYALLRRRHLAPPAWQVAPRPSCRMDLPAETDTEADERAARRALPPLLRGYLRAGAMVCGPPAFDAEFGTADVLVMLPLEQMARRYLRHYGAGEDV